MGHPFKRYLAEKTRNGRVWTPVMLDNGDFMDFDDLDEAKNATEIRAVVYGKAFRFRLRDTQQDLVSEVVVHGGK